MCSNAGMQTLSLSNLFCKLSITRIRRHSAFSTPASMNQVRCIALNASRKRRTRSVVGQPRIYSNSTSRQKSKLVNNTIEEVTKIPEPSVRDLRIVALNVGVPFIGFGIMDNALLIIFGDAIDASLGVALGISTMCAAALGNILSDLAGVMFGTVIEDYCAKIGLPTPKITEAQRTLRSVRHAGQMGCAIGLTIGCIIGMFPLLFINSKNVQRKKKAAHMDRIFRDACTEAKHLIQAETITLFLLRDTRSPDNEDDGWKNLVVSGSPFRGQYLLAKYSDGKESFREMRLPLGRGVISRVMNTGEAINLVDPLKNPDFDKEFSVRGDETKHIMIVPLKNARGEIIGLLQAVNKVNDDGISNDSGGFTMRDLQMISSLASHMSVYLLNMEDEEKISLKETIQLLRRHTTYYREQDFSPRIEKN